MVLPLTCRAINEALSFIVFSFLDLLDFVLCFAYKIADFLIEAEWKPCYCTSAKEAITSCGKILVSEQGESKVVCLSSSKLELEEISDTLYARPSLLSEVSKLTVNELERIKRNLLRTCEKTKKGTVRSTFTINSTIVEMLQGKIEGQQTHPIPRWSDYKAKEDVLFIHGFISSSAFWTETAFPNFSDAAKASYRFFAVDLLGFGRSPKPTDSLYTLREHLEMIERSVIEPYNVKSFHIVAHSLGCILALALAVKHPGSVNSLTLLAPPYYPVPRGLQATQYVMRMVAPRRMWPPIAFGASIACWYEHISRTICLLICKNHRLWEFLAKLVTRNSASAWAVGWSEFLTTKTFIYPPSLEINAKFSKNMFTGLGHSCLKDSLVIPTTQHGIPYTILSVEPPASSTATCAVRDHLKCDVNIFHGRNDELIPVECSYNVQKEFLVLMLR
ncbi:hypothetical protein GH714_038310 [Hevea brasiliensis]|uniref:AB hydrolase-1 domain-containing protein n=1 Tax=Hevea brasiliensis TaxID=3981 RepID=A0A6A6LDV8_HEVBR|nr:hypothetical protein GH714_038310 [Hevea brasiliensis]